jgi:regulation of enolase protein 1 (concanavalin A-like superfamily)
MAAETINLPAIPGALRWDMAPVSWQPDGAGGLEIAAGPRSDLFVDPQGSGATLNAPRLLFTLPEGDFMFSARVTAGFEATFDAAVLLVYAHERVWAKLCLEYSPQGQPMIVSVVTRGVSDDANAFVVAGGSAWLRISRLGPAFAFHASTDGASWEFVRHFTLDAGPVEAGFLAQSPTGAGCTAGFEQLAFMSQRLADLRSGA